MLIERQVLQISNQACSSYGIQIHISVFITVFALLWSLTKLLNRFIIEVPAAELETVKRPLIPGLFSPTLQFAKKL